MECALGMLSLSKGRAASYPVLTPLHHLILIGSDESWQTAGQQHPDQLGKRDSKRYSGNNAHVRFDKGRHQLVASLLIDFAGRYGGVPQVSGVTVGFVSTAAGWNSIGREINTGKPAGVVQNPTTTQTLLDVVHRNAFLILGVIVLNGFIVRSQEGAFDLVTKNKTRDASDQLCQEDQRQEHCIQLEHPWTSTTGGETSEQPENDDGGSSSDKHVWSVGWVFSYQWDIRTQNELPP